jgi:hypothetical protein
MKDLELFAKELKLAGYQTWQHGYDLYIKTSRGFVVAVGREYEGWYANLLKKGTGNGFSYGHFTEFADAAEAATKALREIESE